MSGTDTSETYQKPEWANWIEDPARPHLCRGVECRSCKASLTSILPKEPGDFGPVWLFIDHAEDCKHRYRDTASQQSGGRD